MQALTNSLLLASLAGGVLHYLREHLAKGERLSWRALAIEALAGLFAGGIVGLLARGVWGDDIALPLAAACSYWACQTLNILRETQRNLADVLIARKTGTTVADVRAARRAPRNHAPQHHREPRMTNVTIQLDAADVAALQRTTGKLNAGEALVLLVNRLHRPAARKAAPKAKKPAVKKAAAKGKTELSKAEFLARMAAGRAKAAKARKRK